MKSRFGRSAFLRTKQSMSPIFFYPLCLVLIFIDVCCFAFFEQHLISSLLSLYIIQLLRPFSFLRLAVLILGLSFESFFYYSTVEPLMWYLVPLTVVALIIRKTLYAEWMQRYYLLTGALITQSLLVEPFFFHMNGSPTYTFFKVFANIGVMIVLSLK